jgi:hypothetical protein
MKRILVLFSFILCAFEIAKAQSNLVLNPSFENYYDTSEIGAASFSHGWVTGWSDPNQGSSDLFVPHSGGANTDPPYNIFGFEYPHSGYCFGGEIFLDFVGSNFYEYIQGSFVDSLRSGQTYSIECFVSEADAFPNCLSDLGFYFSNTAVASTPFAERIIVTPQYENPASNMISTRKGWQRITGRYEALGGERYMTIGNFKPYGTCNIITCGDSMPDQSAYLFIDDVAVYDTSKVDTIHLCLNDSVQLGGVWEHDAGLYTDIIGGLPVRFYIAPRPYSANLTIVERPFLPGDSARISLLQTGGNDSGFFVQNFIWVKHDTFIDIPMYNIYGCDSTVRYEAGWHMGIGKNLNDQFSWSVYPNPANDFIQIKLSINDPAKYSVTIIDVAGREVLTHSLTNDKIDISALKSGMYFIKLINTKTGNVVGTEKFVKSN